MIDKAPIFTLDHKLALCSTHEHGLPLHGHDGPVGVDEHSPGAGVLVVCVGLEAEGPRLVRVAVGEVKVPGAGVDLVANVALRLLEGAGEEVDLSRGGRGRGEESEGGEDDDLLF